MCSRLSSTCSPTSRTATCASRARPRPLARRGPPAHTPPRRDRSGVDGLLGQQCAPIRGLIAVIDIIDSSPRLLQHLCTCGTVNLVSVVRNTMAILEQELAGEDQQLGKKCGIPLGWRNADPDDEDGENKAYVLKNPCAYLDAG